MQLVVDLVTDPPGALRFVASILLQAAQGREVAANPPPSTTAEAPAPAPAAPIPPPPPAPVAPPAPASPAPVVPPPPAPSATATNSGERDTDGVPWDERIHSERKTKNKDGTWRVRKNIDKAFVEAVSQSLRDGGPLATALHTGQAAPVPPPPPPAPPAPPVDVPPPETRALFAGNAAPVPPPPPPAPAAPTAPAPDDAKRLEAFRVLMTRVVQMQKDGKLTTQQRVDGCTHVGVSTLQELATSLDRIGAYSNYLDSIIIPQ